MSRPLKVSELAKYINTILSTDPILKRVLLQGDISNLRRGQYIYFDLVDEQALVSCVIFDADMDTSLLQTGKEVLVQGRISTYSFASKYQVIVDKVELLGVGDRLKSLEDLKIKLYKEGLFDFSRKKTLPDFPKNIGLISSKEGAVLHDFANELNSRYPLCKIILGHSSVQGSQAETELIQMLQVFDQMEKIDVIVIARGGGSEEDLNVFNQESLVRAITACKTPIITAIGHQVNNSLADLASDQRASTPTEAAILVSPDISDLEQRLDHLQKDIKMTSYWKIQEKKSDLEKLKKRIDQKSPSRKVDNEKMKLQNLEMQIKRQSFLSVQYKKDLLLDLFQTIGAKYFEKLKPSYWSVEDKEGKALSALELKIGSTYYLKSEDFILEILLEDKKEL